MSRLTALEAHDMFGKASLVVFCLLGMAAQAAPPMELGRVDGGPAVAFVRNGPGDWGLRIDGTPRIAQARPARVEILHNGQVPQSLAAGYKTLRRTPDGVVAEADLKEHGRALFHIRDVWTMHGDVVTVSRQVQVMADGQGGFASSIAFDVERSVAWNDVKFLAPGILYADPTFDGPRSPGGTLNFAAHRLVVREDMLPAPLFAMAFAGGWSVSILDPSPRGDTTMADTTLSAPILTDARFQFGSLGAKQVEDGPVQFGFDFPGNVGLFGPPLPDKPMMSAPSPVRRYHPIARGVDHHYQVAFRIAHDGSFPQMSRNAWRWAWQTLKPPVTPIDVAQVRTVLLDHLQANSATIGGRTGIPFVLSTVTDKLQWNWTMIGMGFVSKNLECADQLLREGDRDPSERGQKMRATGLAIIKSMIEALPTVPLQGTGYDLATGKVWDHVWLSPYLRNATEDMRVLMQAYAREKALNRDHPEWLAWVKNYSDWLIQQQRADGSFPRRWERGSNAVAEASGTASYAPVPLLVLMTAITKDPKYQDAALKAGEFVWSNWGQRGLFVGGASDNPNITDKEAGMLSLEAYLSLYDATHDAKWLERAKAAGDFAESWIWIWNLPMPVDANNADLHWKKGVPTVGLQGITALSAGGADEYLDWAVPSYAKLYRLTGDTHYRDVARVLLHDTKSMVALPGRLYDMKGPGWQQEHWSMGPGWHGRGVGGHRFWLPWVSANHLHGITVLEETDPALFKEFSEGK
ncbi:AGE family epimerase/isomerase [Rhizomicrobium electricum]|nr:AGE family epimerase/isomerase [Rhizomicrobium electricum]NIJ46851.1 hypothetical protein [Rhizomicrobium electricum]